MRTTSTRVVTALALAALVVSPLGSNAEPRAVTPPVALAPLRHILVIYEENHSFDNLYGGWEGVDGLVHGGVVQQDQEGRPYACLKQQDVNLRALPAAQACQDPLLGGTGAFPNAPFVIDDLIGPGDTTCPTGAEGPDGVPKGAGLPGGCTRDLVHRYYQEQFQIHGGAMDRYVLASDAAGLSMGHYDTRRLPIYRYLHEPGAPAYLIADRFFQSAFGGSFLNHQWLIAAATPTWPDARNDGSALDLHAVLDANGMPGKTPLYTPVGGGAWRDTALSASCQPAPGRPSTAQGVVCGDYAVNTIQPWAWPYHAGTAAEKRLPPLRNPTIGDRLSDAGVDWAWYAGGWSNAEGKPNDPGYTNGAGPDCKDTQAAPGSTWPRCPDRSFQHHHQPFNYFARYAPGTAERERHVRDEVEFLKALQASTSACQLKPVSFVKPLGRENEHPGYASEHAGSDHLVVLLRAWHASACAKDTLVIVTYDEYGGQADHVAPPSASNPIGPHDVWGPGTRIPALILAPGLRQPFAVDHTVYDTTSILATIERRFGLMPLGVRDRDGRDLGEGLGGR
jgi:phospholipase C